jgi:hypothetical protein
MLKLTLPAITMSKYGGYLSTAKGIMATCVQWKLASHANRSSDWKERSHTPV